MANIDYKNAINKILSTTLNMALSKNGMDLMNNLMDSLNSRFVNYYVENTQDVSDVTTTRNAVDLLFAGNLKRLALAEGNRTLMLYSNELIEYKPHYPVKTKKKTKKQLVIAALEFSDGISDLTSLTFSEASLQEQANRIFCELLEEVAVRIASYIHSRKKENITVQDIRNALQHLLPPEILKHALAEGARIAMLFETGLLEEPIRKPAAVKAKRKQEPEKVPKKRRVMRKRKRSPSVQSSPRRKRRRSSSSRKVSRKKTTRGKSPRRRVSRKRATSRKATGKVTKKKPISRRTVSEEDDSTEVPRKRRARKRATRKITKEKISKRAPSRKRRVSSSARRKATPSRKKRARSRKRTAVKKRSERISAKTGRRISPSPKRRVSSSARRKATPSRKKRTQSRKRTAVRKRAERVSPKTVRRISKKKPTKKETVSKKVTSRGVAATTIKEIERGSRKLNITFRQKLPAESTRITTEFMCSLLDELITEIGKLKTSVIGPQEVRSAVLKIFPPDLAQLAIAHLSRVLMT